MEKITADQYEYKMKVYEDILTLVMLKYKYKYKC